MHIDKIENRLKQEVVLSFVGIFNKENIAICDNAINECINSSEWEKVIIDFSKTEDIDIEAIKLLWKTKDIANSVQKSLEFEKVSGKIAVAFKVLGFSEKFNMDINIDENIINKIILLGEYEEPLYEIREINPDISFEKQIISLDIISNFVDKINKKFQFDVKEWAVIPDRLKNKLIFLLEANNISEVEKAEEYLYSLVTDKYDIECSMYILENGAFSDYYERKKHLGIPTKAISAPKVIRNPYTQQYFLGRIDERY